MGESKTWPMDVQSGPFSFLRVTVRRTMASAAGIGAGEFAYFLAASITELDECAAGVHNCAPQATCTNTNGSFTCAYNTGTVGNGVACGIQIPPGDIGRGDKASFTWTKDDTVTFGGFIMIYKDYNGGVCPGHYRIYSPQLWYNNPGANVTTLAVGIAEWLLSSLFNGTTEGAGWSTAPNAVVRRFAANESDVQIILGLPCYVIPTAYTWHNRDCCLGTSPSSMNVSAANSTDGPWTALHSFNDLTDWMEDEMKTWNMDVIGGPFSFLRFTLRRVRSNVDDYRTGAGENAYFLASSVTELDECATGMYNCDPDAPCTNTNGSFTCNCTQGFEGDGVACGVRIPPIDIRRGDNLDFTWTKDLSQLYTGTDGVDRVTSYKNYTGDVCSGQFRAYSSHNWHVNPGNIATVDVDEHNPASLFDGSNLGWPWHTTDHVVAGLLNETELDPVYVFLETPCFVSPRGYAIQGREESHFIFQNPSAVNMSGSNSSSGPWMTLHSFEGVAGWEPGEIKTWPVDQREVASFKVFRFSFRRVVNDYTSVVAADQAYILSAPLTTNECSLGIHNCDPKSTCTKTSDSFTCVCNSGFEGDGVTCSIRIPPSDIGRGDDNTFQWQKDDQILFGGHVTFSKGYAGTICPGEFRVYAPSNWHNNPGVQTTIGVNEYPPSSLFDASAESKGWCSSADNVSGLTSPTESDEIVVLGTLCYISLTGYAVQGRDDCCEAQAPSAMNVSGSNSTDGPWTILHSFESVNQAYLLADAVIELDECAAGVHNCHLQANCTNTNGSFFCTCYPGLEGDGVNVCGITLPPLDIGRGDSGSSWDRDIKNTTVGGSEGLSSSLFDRDVSGLPWKTANIVAGLNDVSDSDEHIILGTLCHITLNGFAWNARADCCANESHSALNLTGANSTNGPWTAIHSFSGVTDWTPAGFGVWPVNASTFSGGPFNFFRFTVRRVNSTAAGVASGAQAILSAASWTEVDECATGLHDCDAEAVCTNMNGSFTCTCNAGFGGDRVFCGLRVPPEDIGRGDSDSFT
uniref:EGF-like domain-containing protein n=1 Tax=Chromera velia CCMP2878 TaxID=1169474 RepID=A0A0G4HTB2_9ALVE|eukprot:Cvel_8410.t1-p1 / transcript=Cvel_8410.t1 / gene=Cvel_8410 / organism=Chromera_velia_CCMP2878 / gene_product=Fibrillin-2, putative / transcript_product=Fibrillin-2, putative / location=Cvel_scaffold464:52297-59256(-) / protein_length=1026 / sequence_SO=supercontig / SO=protein_coding / is_pseudo=false